MRTGQQISPLFMNSQTFTQSPATFPVVRVPVSSRRFKSNAIERAITEFQLKVEDEELGWLFGNCFPNTLDTTVFFEMKEDKPSTYVITGDIDAMWLRDSTAQVWPYLKFINEDVSLQQLIAGVLNKQTQCILNDPYANAFYNDETEISKWQTDFTDMKPGVHERKWEIDSLCYPIRLAYHYWKTTGDVTPFDSPWQKAIETTLQVFREQQRKDGAGPYKFQRMTRHASDSLPLDGYGYPVKAVGLICSSFRPSDDASLFSFLIPSNFFAVVVLRQAAEMMEQIARDAKMAQELRALAQEVEEALQQHAIVEHPRYGPIYAYEVNGYGSYHLMDDANIPSLLSLPYLGAIQATDPIYRNTRRFLLSLDNPFFFRGEYAEGIGGPHIGMDMIWPMSIIMQALTSDDDEEIRACLESLKRTHGDTGFMHETFHKDDPRNFTRAWFAWTNTIFGELLWKIYQEKPSLLVERAL
jgi:meiotically up-regulated gene 157 (Mug157) protein